MPTNKPEGFKVRIRSNHPWQHNDTYSRDPVEMIIPPDIPQTMITYTVSEFDELSFDKANKTGETTHGNIALLDGSDGDLVDSGIHPSELQICLIDCGEF